jgi:putative component of membrane protein insertase Oxa1/YidC/SpoIIIJ protein YidD
MLCYTWGPSRLCRSLFTESQKHPSQRFPHPRHCFCLVHVHAETQPDERSISTNALESCNLDPRDVTNLDQVMSARILECQDFSEGGNSGPTMIQRTKGGGMKRKRLLRSQGLYRQGADLFRSHASSSVLEALAPMTPKARAYLLR